MDNQICHECGHEMIHDVKPMTLTYKGLSRTFDMPGLYCTHCEEGILSGKDMEISDRALNKLKAEADNLLRPEEIRRIRHKLRLTQAKAGMLLGGGPNAFHKYESGVVLPSQAICSTLCILNEYPNAMDVLLRRVEGRNMPSCKTPSLPYAS